MYLHPLPSATFHSLTFQSSLHPLTSLRPFPSATSHFPAVVLSWAWCWRRNARGSCVLSEDGRGERFSPFCSFRASVGKLLLDRVNGSQKSQHLLSACSFGCTLKDGCHSPCLLSWNGCDRSCLTWSGCYLTVNCPSLTWNVYCSSSPIWNGWYPPLKSRCT